MNDDRIHWGSVFLGACVVLLAVFMGWAMITGGEPGNPTRAQWAAQRTINAFYWGMPAEGRPTAQCWEHEKSFYMCIVNAHGHLFRMRCDGDHYSNNWGCTIGDVRYDR